MERIDGTHACPRVLRPGVCSTGPRALGLCAVLMLCLVGGTSVWVSTMGEPRAPATRSAAPRASDPHGLSTLPAAARSAVADRLGAADRRFWANPTPAGAAYADVRSGIDVQVSSRGAIVRAGRLSWAIGLRALGRGARSAPAGAASLRVHANRVTIERAGATEERYDDGPLGLEQEFTIGRRPAGPAASAVVLALGEVPPGVNSVLARDGTSLWLERGGREIVRYWGLSASDARGRALPARIFLAGRGLTLRVVDRGARYPIRVDPFVQAAELTASDGAANDEAGTAVAVSGNTIAVGAWAATVGNNEHQGAVYVFVKPAAGWASAHETAKLTASDGAADDQLGWSVAISGDTILAGAPGATIGANSQQGAAYVFLKPGGGWVSEHQAAELTNAAGAAGDNFGDSAAVSADTAVVGVPHEGNGIRQNTPGSVYVFAKAPAGWGDSGTPTAHLTASDGVVPDLVGFSVAIDGDTIVAGAEHEDIGGNSEQGALYVFVKAAGGWADATETKKLAASDGASGNQLGYSVAIAGDTIAAGAPFPSGAVYVFVRPAGGWANAGGTQTAKLIPSDPNDGFGKATAMSGDTIVAAAPDVTVSGHANQGKLYVFAKPGGGWANGHEDQQLTASDGAATDQLGLAAGVSGSTIAAGAPGVGQFTGAVYVFSSTAQSATTTAVDCQPRTVAVGSPTSCTATVSNGGVTAPTGSVGFSSDSSGTFDSAGTCTLAPTGNPGEASCRVGYTPTAVGSGTHTITASYRGDGANAGSSASATVTVPGGGGGGPRPTSTSVSCSPASVTVGNQTGCGATVTDTGGGPLVTPTGTVSFTSDSQGTFSSGSCTLAAINAASAGCLVGYTTAAVDSGTHTITSAYGGDGSHSASSGRVGVGVAAAPPISAQPTRPPQNTALPSIRPDRSCQFLIARLVCQVIPYQYVCDPGQWAGNDPAAPYQFKWQQLYYVRTNFALNAVWQTEPNGNAQIYSALQHASVYIASGLFRCLVTATGPGGSTQAISAAMSLQVGPPLPRGLPWPTPVNIIVTGIEVTQAVQSFGCAGCTGSLPSRDQLNSNTPGQATYQGVTLAAGKFTVVRVFAHFLGSKSTLAGATAQLDVFDSNGTRLSVLSPDSSPAALTPPPCSYCVSPAERANPGSSFNFLVPWQETNHRALTFRATVTPPSGPLAVTSGVGGQCGSCRGNVFTLDSVPFVPTATIPIHPIPLTAGGISGPCGTPLALRCTKQTPQQVFGDGDTVLPFHFQVYPYDSPLDVTGQGDCPAAVSVSVRGAQNNLSAGDFGVGVFYKGEGSLVAGCTEGGHTLFNNGAASAVLDTGRSLTSVLHEIGHGLSLPHADTGTRQVNACCPPKSACPPTPVVTDNCGPHPDGTPDCGGNTNGQTGETWPPGSGNPDNEGLLDGIGLDRRSWDIFQTGSLPSTFVAGFDGQGKSKPGAQYFDLMSYCGDGTNFPVNFEADHWISLTNWNRLIAYHPPAQTLPAAADRQARAEEGTALHVIAIVEYGGNTSIVHVAPGERALGGPTPGSPYRIELRDQSGNVLDSVVPTTGDMHVDLKGTRPEMLLEATLPFAPAAAVVTVSADGQELARRTRSAHAPSARFVSPRPRALLGRRRTTLVRWQAHDADGDALTSTVEYSPDGGRHWKVVAGPVTATSVRVPSRLLSASRNARLRVQVSDGFNVTTATSGRLGALGAPPTVQIIGAPRRGHVMATASLLLEGSAFDDADQPVAGRHLRWYLDKRPIGIGQQVTARNLTPGRTVIRLVATDKHGRSSQAILPLRVSPVAARFVLFDAPLLVSPRAHSVRIELASSTPATLRIAGRTYAVGSRPRTITVHIQTGRSPIVLRCVLHSPGGMIHATYVALRPATTTKRH